MTFELTESETSLIEIVQERLGNVVEVEVLENPRTIRFQYEGSAFTLDRGAMSKVSDLNELAGVITGKLTMTH